VPLSKCTILGAAIGNYVSISRARHPKADRPLIDYEVSTLMQAGELLGVTLGVLLNLLLPEVVIMIFLALLLSFNAYKTLKKGRSKYRAETEAFAKEAKAELLAEGAEAAGAIELSPKFSAEHTAHLSALEESKAELRSFLENEAGVPAAAVTKFLDFGVESMGDLEDDHIVNDAMLRNVIGLSLSGASHLTAALAKRKDDDELNLQPDLNALNFSEDLRSAVEQEEEKEEPANDREHGDDDLDLPGHLTGREEVAKGKEEAAEGGAEAGAKGGQSLELASLYADAAMQFPRWAYAVVISMTLFTIFYALMKADVLTPCYSKAAYWSWTFVTVPVLGLCMLGIAVYLNQIHEKRVLAGYQYLPADIQFTTEQLWKFPVTAVNAGLAAGLLGIGGGMVIGPLFIEIGMEPQVGTSSCAYMILWTAFSGVVQYYYAGKLGWRFALFFASLGFISGQIGQRGVSAVLKKSGRPSVVVLLLGSIIGLACVVMTLSTVIDVATSTSTASELFALETEWATCGYSKSH